MPRIARSHTFDFSLQETKIGLVNADETLLPVSGALHHLAHFLRLLLVRQRTDAITGDDVLEDGELGQERKLPDEGIILDWLRMGRGGNLRQGKRVQTSKQAQLSRRSEASL